MRAHTVFDPERLRSASHVERRHVLSLDGTRPLSLGEPLRVAGPPELGPPANARRIHLYNPSIVPAPGRLCPRCAFLVALRADTLHQCDATNPFQHREKGMPAVVAMNAWFKGTVLAVLANLDGPVDVEKEGLEEVSAAEVAEVDAEMEDSQVP